RRRRFWLLRCARSRLELQRVDAAAWSAVGAPGSRHRVVYAVDGGWSVLKVAAQAGSHEPELRLARNSRLRGLFRSVIGRSVCALMNRMEWQRRELHFIASERVPPLSEHLRGADVGICGQTFAAAVGHASAARYELGDVVAGSGRNAAAIAQAVRGLLEGAEEGSLAPALQVGGASARAASVTRSFCQGLDALETSLGVGQEEEAVSACVGLRANGCALAAVAVFTHDPATDVLAGKRRLASRRFAPMSARCARRRRW
ncbi:unnamed protein product, partial [Effrenium voratum]